MNYYMTCVTCNIFTYCILLISVYEFVSSEEANTLNNRRFQGRYTKGITEYQVVIPKKIHKDGNFHSYSIPHFYQRVEARQPRKRRDTNPEKDILHYSLYFNGKNHHIELVPNLDFMAPGLVIETRHGKSLRNVQLKGLHNKQSHYTGKVRGEDGSRVALSVGDGLVGYIKTTVGHYYIEPALHSHPTADGHHIHLIYQDNDKEPGSHSNVQSQVNSSTCGNNEDSHQGWRNGIEQVRQTITGSPQKRSSSKQRRYIKSLVAADTRFLEHHRDLDVETYILTIMNMASDYFHDETVGSLVDIVVVRIVLLEKTGSGMDPRRCVNRTLHSFCTWQDSVNPADVQHPNHHDVAILLTRRELCSEKGNATSLLGSSHLGSACTPGEACSVNVDTGLLLGVVVTHGIGHLLGCSHDSLTTNGCSPQAEDKSYYVMAPVPKSRTGGWSNCSRSSMTEFFDGNLGRCLLTEPSDPRFNYPEMLPGSMYDAAQQCEIAFGPGATPCQTAGDTFCRALRCHTRYTRGSCFTRGEPPADGTGCGADKWCFAGRCVETGERPGAVNGGWGNWTPWGPCSRTCGGGVAAQERSCDSPAPRNRGRYCPGEQRHYQTCNITPCNITSVPYREAQCRSFNDNAAKKVHHSWRVYMPRTPYNRCALLCVNERGRYKTLGPRVKDGTPCRAGVRDMCVGGGGCVRVGCDWTLGSDAIEDQCGICRGDGTQCNIVSGTYRQGDQGECSTDIVTTTTTTTTSTCKPAETVTPNCTPKQHKRSWRDRDNAESKPRYVRGGKERRSNEEYRRVKTIPKGVRNLKIWMLKPSPNNSVALAGENGTRFYLNGRGSCVTPGDEGGFEVGRVSGFYAHPEPDLAEVIVAGPVPEDLTLYVVVRNAAAFPELGYTYAVPSANASYLPRYHWEFLSWGECSGRCGGGTQQSDPGCVEANNGRVTNSFCHATERPATLARACGQRACGVGWRAEGWGVCGNGRRQRREVRCVREAARVGDEDTDLPDQACRREKPKTARHCPREPKRNATGKRTGRDRKQRHGLRRDVSQAPHHCTHATHNNLQRSLANRAHAHSKQSLHALRSASHLEKHQNKKYRVGVEDDDDDDESVKLSWKSNCVPRPRGWNKCQEDRRSDHERHYHDKRLKSFWCDHKLSEDRITCLSGRRLQNMKLRRLEKRLKAKNAKLRDDEQREERRKLVKAKGGKLRDDEQREERRKLVKAKSEKARDDKLTDERRKLVKAKCEKVRNEKLVKAKGEKVRDENLVKAKGEKVRDEKLVKAKGEKVKDEKFVEAKCEKARDETLVNVPGEVPMMAVLVLNDMSQDVNQVTVGNNQYIISKGDILRRLEKQPGGTQVMLVPGTSIKKSPIHNSQIPGTSNKYSTNATNSTQAKNKPMREKPDKKKPLENLHRKTTSAPSTEVAPARPLMKHPLDKHKCANSTKRKGSKKLPANKSTVIEDFLPSDDMVLKESAVVPQRTGDPENPTNHARLSDDSNAAMGDRVGRVVLDLAGEKVYRGAEAVRKLKLIENRSKMYSEELANMRRRTKKMKDRSFKHR